MPIAFAESIPPLKYAHFASSDLDFARFDSDFGHSDSNFVRFDLDFHS
ncbi:hypothetical protein [Capnocytophaga felis]|nr:hypothetical protein [Capnocytophaga felis]